MDPTIPTAASSASSAPACADELFELAWALHERARQAEQIEVAYHALAAALNAAEIVSDAPRIMEVLERAVSEQARIDRDLPAHRLASPEHAPREGRSDIHHAPLYRMLARTAEAARARVAAEAAVDRAEQRKRHHMGGAPRIDPWPGPPGPPGPEAHD